MKVGLTSMSDRASWRNPKGGIVAYAPDDLPSPRSLGRSAAVRWAGFVGGAALGGFAFGRAGLDALWLAAAAVAICSAASLVWRVSD